MIWIIGGLLGAAVAAATGANVILVALGLGMILGAVSVALGRPRANVAAPTVTRMPTEYEQSQHGHWRLGIGLGISTVGVFPFITIYRRPRL